VRRKFRDKKLARPESFLDALPIIMVVCEGGTEKEYVERFAESVKNQRVKVTSIGHVGVPRTVVQRAKELKQANDEQARRESDDYQRFDTVWAVVDEDDHQCLKSAIQTAKDNSIEIAVSSPNFELWLYLHFAEQPGMQHRDKLTSMLKKFDPSYDKHVKFALYEANSDKAILRAQRLETAATEANEPYRNPTTGYWRLVDSVKTKQT